jgi:hypothetical protein
MPLVNDTEERTVSVISQYSFYTDNIHAIFLKQMRKEETSQIINMSIILT